MVPCLFVGLSFSDLAAPLSGRHPPGFAKLLLLVAQWMATESRTARKIAEPEIFDDFSCFVFQEKETTENSLEIPGIFRFQIPGKTVENFNTSFLESSVHTRCIVKTSGFTRGVCKNRGFY